MDSIGAGEAGRPDADIDEITADGVRKRALEVLADSSRDAMQVGRLATEIAADRDRDRDRLMVFLHEVHLPRMVDANAVEYEWTTGEVVYHGTEQLDDAGE